MTLSSVPTSGLPPLTLHHSLMMLFPNSSSAMAHNLDTQVPTATAGTSMPSTSLPYHVSSFQGAPVPAAPANACPWGSNGMPGNNGNGSGAADSNHLIAQLLAAPECDARATAASHLGKSNDPTVCSALLFALITDPEHHVRAKAAEAVGILGPAVLDAAQAFPFSSSDIAHALVFSLTDPSEFVREKVQATIAQLGPFMLPFLGQAIGHELVHLGDHIDGGIVPPVTARDLDHLSIGAAYAIGMIGDPQGVAPLYRLLSEGADRFRTSFREDPVHVREAAATALGWFGNRAGRDTITAIHAMLQNDQRLHRAYEEAFDASRNRPANRRTLR